MCVLIVLVAVFFMDKKEILSLPSPSHSQKNFLSSPQSIQAFFFRTLFAQIDTGAPLVIQRDNNFELAGVKSEEALECGPRGLSGIFADVYSRRT